MRSRNYPDLFLYAYLTMAMGCLYLIFNYIGGVAYVDRAGDTLAFRLVWIALYIGLVLSIARHPAMYANLLLHARLLIIFIVVSMMSLWLNGVGADGLSRFVLYLVTILFGAWLAARSIDEVVEAMFYIGIGVLVLHISLYPFIGSAFDYDLLGRPTILGTESYAGVFAHKNLAGFFFGLLATISAVRLFSDGTRRQFCVSAIAGAAHLLALAATGAAGPLVAFVVAMVITLGAVLVGSRRWRMFLLYVAVVALTLIVIIADDLNNVFELVGRTSGLTGRVFLWSAWPHFFMQKPWLGYGYGGFFTAATDGAAAPALADGAVEHALHVVRKLVSGTGDQLWCHRRRHPAADHGRGARSFIWIWQVRRGEDALGAVFRNCVCTGLRLNDTGFLLHNHIACALVVLGLFRPGRAARRRL